MSDSLDPNATPFPEKAFVDFEDLDSSWGLDELKPPGYYVAVALAFPPPK